MDDDLWMDYFGVEQRWILYLFWRTVATGYCY